jgi:uncharacterized protein
MTLTAPYATYVDYLRQGKLAYQVDALTGAAGFFPRAVAPGSGRPLEWRVSEGLGTVYTTTVMHRRDAPPDNLAMIDLDEGFRMMSRVEGISAEEVHIGMRVQLHVHPVAECEAPLPVFLPVGERVR